MPERSAIRLFFLEEKVNHAMKGLSSVITRSGLAAVLGQSGLFPSLHTLDDFAQGRFLMVQSFRQIPQ